MRDERNVPEFELSEATKRHIESVIAQEMTQVVAVMSAAMQNKIIEAASKQSESQPTE